MPIFIRLAVPFLICATALGAQTRGLGRISFPNSGPAAAQAPFLRGVALLHSFEYDDAILAFREAQRIAPSFAMAYWGEALCYDQPLWYNEDVGKARAALARLGATRESRAAKAPTPREKGYLDAIERLFGDGDRRARVTAYADRMAALARDNPADDEAALFHALALLATIPQGQRRPDDSLKAGAIAAAVLKKNREHPGAAHYVLHAYDDGVNNAKALDAARIYAKIAPESSHALHMPSHAFLPLGMWDEAARSDEAAFAASVAWVKRTGRTAAQQDFHSLSWLHYEYLQQGRFEKAREAADLVERALADASNGSGPGGAHQHVESEIGRGYGQMSLRNELASMRARYVIESRDWALMKGQARFDNIDELFALGLGSIPLGDPGRAEASIEQLVKASKAMPEPDLREVASIMADQVRGVLQFARGDRKTALATLAGTVAAEARRPPPIARPYPIKPAAELYGELLLAAGDMRGAMAQFQAALKRTPHRPAALIGLASAAFAADARKEAAAAAREFLDVWDRADPGRPELADVHHILEESRKIAR